MAFKVIIIDFATSKLRTTDIISNYKIENFKRKIERLFGKHT